MTHLPVQVALHGDSGPSLRRRLAKLGSYHTLFALYLIASLLIFTFLVPPFQKADEPAHYLRSVSLTNLDLTCSRDESGNYLFEMKRKYADLPEQMHYWEVWHREVDFDFDWLRTDFSASSYDREVAVYQWCSLPPAGYLPGVLGVLAGKPFGTPLVGFYLARLLGAAFFLTGVIFALRVIPDRYRLLVYLYAALPTVLHQVSAISYDAVQLSLFPLLFAFFARFLVEDIPIRRFHLIAFMVLLVWIINVRLLAYYPILLLFFAVPRSRVATPFSNYLRLTATFLVAAGLVTGTIAALYVQRAQDFEPGDYPVDAAEQVRFVIGHPLDFLAACYNTLDRNGEYMLRGFIGFFGWIVDYGFNWLPFYIFIGIAAVVVYRLMQSERALLRPWQLAVLAGAVFMTGLSIFFALYAGWSPVGDDEVRGVHGRYFLGLLPFGALLLTQTAVTIGRERLVRLILITVAVTLVFNMFRAVDLRYH